MRYFRDMFRLIIKAGLVWGVKDFRSMSEWAELVRQTPLRYEVDRLEQERIAIIGRTWR
jgi:hypothetical protein